MKRQSNDMSNKDRILVSEAVNNDAGFKDVRTLQEKHGLLNWVSLHSQNKSLTFLMCRQRYMIEMAGSHWKVTCTLILNYLLTPQNHFHITVSRTSFPTLAQQRNSRSTKKLEINYNTHHHIISLEFLC